MRPAASAGSLRSRRRRPGGCSSRPRRRRARGSSGSPPLPVRSPRRARDGYAIVREEFEPGVVAAAVPIRDAAGRVVAALNVSAPRFRFDGRLNDAAALLVEISDELSARAARRAPARMTALWHPFADMAAVEASGELVIARGEGVRVFDEAGRGYLDGASSLWYANAGHGRPEIREAVHRQLAALDAFHAFGDFASRPALELADRLAALAPSPARRSSSRAGAATRSRRRDEARAPLPLRARRAWPPLPDQPHERLSRHARHRHEHPRHALQDAFSPLVEQTAQVAVGLVSPRSSRRSSRSARSASPPSSSSR